MDRGQEDVENVSCTINEEGGYDFCIPSDLLNTPDTILEVSNACPEELEKLE